MTTQDADNAPPDILAHGTRVYDALLALAGPAEVLAELRRLRACRADLEALAALAAPDPEVIEDLIQQLADRGARGSTGAAREVWQRIQRRMRQPEAPPAAEPRPELDIPGPYARPYGYVIEADGVYRLVEKAGPRPKIERALVCQQPLVVVGQSRDLAGGEAYLRLRYRDAGRWQDLDVRAASCLQRNQIVGALVDAGILVSSESAGELVRYLEQSLGPAAVDLPRAATSRVMGWLPGGFLAGRTWYPGEEGGEVRLADHDPGLRQLADGFGVAGSWEGWCGLVERIRPWPRVQLALLAAFAAPLIRVIGSEVENGILDLAGETSQGKTTSLRVAASVWGRPSERDGLIQTWDLTPTHLERIAAALCDLPLLVDDTKRGNPEHIGQRIYQVSNGRGKGRATPTGMQASAEWRTFLISTGEQPLTSFSEDAGGSARVLSVWGAPITEPDPEAAAAVARDLSARAYAHHGHAGPRLARWLVGVDPAVVRAWYREGLAVAQRQTAGSAVAARGSSALGLLWAACEAARAVGVPELGDAWWGEAVEAIRRGAARADVPRRALDALFGWISANAHRFHGREAYDEAPSGETAGRWGEGEFWHEVCVDPQVVRRELQRMGYTEPDAAIRAWSDRGWLRRDGAHLCPKVGLPGRGAVRMLALQRAALEPDEEGR